MAFTYSIVDSFSIVFLLIIFVSTREKSEKLRETFYFRTIVLLTAAALLSDMVAWQLDGHGGTICRCILWVSNILCYILSGAITFCWFYYTGLKMNRLIKISKLGWAIILLPGIVLTVLSLLTPWTHLMFYFDESNIYHRGPLCFIQMTTSFLYLLLTAVWALYRAKREQLHQQKVEYYYLSSFIVFPLVGGILQFLFYGVSIIWPCTALSLMLVYVNMQNQKISLDALTGLNNRGQLDKHLYRRFEHEDDEMPFALFMLDIDEFKKINDEFGHTAGDAALIDAAEVLKKALENTNSFLARYGGDEFAIILNYTNEEQINILISKISDESIKRCNCEGTPYKLVFSVGYACYDKHRYSNYQDMITAADAHMYIQKRQHKAERK